MRRSATTMFSARFIIDLSRRRDSVNRCSLITRVYMLRERYDIDALRDRSRYARIRSRSYRDNFDFEGVGRGEKKIARRMIKSRVESFPEQESSSVEDSRGEGGMEGDIVKRIPHSQSESTSSSRSESCDAIESPSVIESGRHASPTYGPFRFGFVVYAQIGIFRPIFDLELSVSRSHFFFFFFFFSRPARIPISDSIIFNPRCVIRHPPPGRGLRNRNSSPRPRKSISDISRRETKTESGSRRRNYRGEGGGKEGECTCARERDAGARRTRPSLPRPC